MNESGRTTTSERELIEEVLDAPDISDSEKVAWIRDILDGYDALDLALRSGTVHEFYDYLQSLDLAPPRRRKTRRILRRIGSSLAFIGLSAAGGLCVAVLRYMLET